MCVYKSLDDCPSWGPNANPSGPPQACFLGIEGERECNQFRFGGLNQPDDNDLQIDPELCGDCRYSQMQIPGLCIKPESKLSDCLGIARAEDVNLEQNAQGESKEAIAAINENKREVEWHPVSVYEWLACESRRWVDGVTKQSCNKDAALVGSSVSFSQRRNMASLSFANRAYVLGGRSRAHEDLVRRACNKNYFQRDVLGGEIKGLCGDGIMDVDGCIPEQLCLDWQNAALDNVCMCDNDDEAIASGICELTKDGYRYKLLRNCKWNESPKCAARMETCLREKINWREGARLSNDIWATLDGRSWEMITPGCVSPQQDLIGLYGASEKGMHNRYCETDSDCDVLFPDSGIIYGTADKCNTQTNTCYCPMWSPRELHAAAIYPKEPEIAKVPTKEEPRYMWMPEYESASIPDYLDTIGCEKDGPGPPQRMCVLGLRSSCLCFLSLV